MTQVRKNQLSNVMKMAWAIIKAEAVSKSQAMKRAWANVKNAVANTAKNIINEGKKMVNVNPKEINSELKMFAGIFFTTEEREAGRQVLLDEYEYEINDLGTMLMQAKDAIVWIGDTYANREQIKATGAKWDTKSKMWFGGETHITISGCYPASVFEMIVTDETNKCMQFFGTSKNLNQIHFLAKTMDNLVQIVKILMRAKLTWMACDNLAEKVGKAEVANFANEESIHAIFEILLPVLGDETQAQERAQELAKLTFN